MQTNQCDAYQDCLVTLEHMILTLNAKYNHRNIFITGNENFCHLCEA